jgi:sugar lactone lactonase YvrE
MKSEVSLPSLASLLLRAALPGFATLALLAAPARAALDYATPYTFALDAGTGYVGSADGAATAATFNSPAGLAVDSSGNLFVVDRGNNVIREISSSGAVTTLAGLAGSSGSTDGTGTAALFNQPYAVAVGSGGDLYVTDTDNNLIRKVTPQGVVTTLAGGSTGGSVDGTGAAALFRSPSGIAVDSSGNLYVADTGNNSIRKVTQAGVVTTLAGTEGVASTADEAGAISPPGSVDGTGAAASFSQPTGLAIDSAGNLFVTDLGNETIRKVTSTGVVTTIAGKAGQPGATDGTGAAALFNGPLGIAVDSSDDVFVADTSNSVIRKVTSAGVVTTIAGAPNNYAVVEGTGSAVIFDVPFGVALDSSGNVYVSERLGEIIAKGAVSNVATPPAVPVFTTEPLSVTTTGGPLALTATATGATSYQWMLDGTTKLVGSTSSTLFLDPATGGSYSCVATNTAGSTTSTPAVVTVTSTTNPGRLVNLSCRAQVGTGGNILITGFAVGGAGTSGTDSLLVRGSGPALIPFGVTGTLTDPALGYFSGSTEVASNDGWGGSAAITSAAASVAAFTWSDPSSHDAALIVNPGVGAYTAQVSGESGDTGVALAEIYDLSAAGTYTATTPHLTNLSARVQVGTGGNILIAGFVIGGTTAQTVLIRASGPALAPFGVTGTLADPELQLLSGTTTIASDTGWQASPDITTAASLVGAFSWGTSATADSALLITLPPGAYTAQVSGAGGDTGVALVEVYEVQ